MAKNIKGVFEEVAKDVKIDKDLIDRIHRYETEFRLRNQEHISFFGGNLLGVDKVRFKPTDDWNRWFDVVLKLDDVTLRQELHALPSINEEFIVSSDVMNITCAWLLHAIYNSKLTPALKHQGMIDTLLVFHYKVLSSKLAHDFKFPANRETAIAVYAALSKKYSLKQYGSWGALLRARSEDVISETSIHFNTIRYFDDDKQILYILTDTQGRIKDVVKKQWDVLNEVRESDRKIVSTSATINVEGEDIIRDLTRNVVVYKNYIHSVVDDRSTFIKDILMKVVASAMHTMSPAFLREVLEYVSDNYDGGTNRDIEKLIDETMLHAFDFLHREYEGNVRTIDLEFIVTKLRGIYMSSRSTDPVLLGLRDLADKIIKQKLKNKSPSAVAAVRTGLMLYIVIRAFARNHYA